MNTQTFISRVEKANAHRSQHNHIKSTKGYKLALELCTTDTAIRPCYTSGSGRFTSNQDHTEVMLNVLKAAKVEYTLTNDAARGSATGNVVTLSAVGRAATKGMRPAKQ